MMDIVCRYNMLRQEIFAVLVLQVQSQRAADYVCACVEE